MLRPECLLDSAVIIYAKVAYIPASLRDMGAGSPAN